MTEQERRESIASLRGNRGYLFLLEDFETGVTGILAALAEAKTDSQVTRLGRLFQSVYRFQSLLKMAPERALEEIDTERANLTDAGVPEGLKPLDPSAPPFPPNRQALLDVFDRAALEQIQTETKE